MCGTSPSRSGPRTAGGVTLRLIAETGPHRRLTYYVEDVRSGQRVQFDSLEPLLEFIARMFRAADAVAAASGGKPPAGRSPDIE